MLTPSDVVSIKVVNQPDMDTTTRVETDGTVSFPYVGRVRAAGQTEDQLARTIEGRLASRQIVTDPHVLVEISTFGTQATVQGQVGSSGRLHARPADDADPVLVEGGRGQRTGRHDHRQAAKARSSGDSKPRRS